jgi:pimeloyl-ACP methyl ester carboxylesterase
MKKSVSLWVLFLITSVFMFFFTPDLNRQDLERRYAGPPSEFITLQGLRIHYRDTGPKEAPPVVLLHGFGSSLHTWEPWAQTLEKTHRVIRLDLAGFGLTGADPSQNYSDEADVQRLLVFLDGLKLNPIDLVGHSMGGRIAWNFASAYPSRVRRLVLMAPDGFPLAGQKLGDRPYDFGRVADFIQVFLPKFLVRKSLEAAFYDASTIQEPLINRYSDLLRAPTVRSSILDRMRQTVNSDPRDRLQRISSPTLLLWGENDQMIPSSNSRDYEKELLHSKTIILDKAGHLLQEENAQRSLTPVLEFIDQIQGH